MTSWQSFRFLSLLVLFVVIGALSTLGRGQFVGVQEVEAQSGWVCDPANSHTFTLLPWSSNSSWQFMTNSGDGFTGVKIESTDIDGHGYKLNLATDWSSTAIYDVLDFPAVDGDVVALSTTKLPSTIIGVITRSERNSNSATVTVTLCTGSDGGGSQGGGGEWVCDAADSHVFTITPWAGNSTWDLMTNDGSDFDGVRIESKAGSKGLLLNLASNWSSNAIFERVEFPATNGDVVAFDTSSVPSTIVGFVTRSVVTPATVTMTVTLCTGGGDPPGDCTESGVMAGSTEPATDSSGNLLTAQDSGCPLSTAFMTGGSHGNHYWANHEGVMRYRNTGQLSDACVELHDSYWTLGPNGMAFPTWHPHVKVHPNGETCAFGHEHGDDPNQSPFYTESQYAGLRADGFIPIPFGYANEVYAENGGVRHEDHFGHKIYVEHFEVTEGNSAIVQPLTPTGSTCHALLKLHQGTHSDDALRNHLHEAIAHVDCTQLYSYVPSRVHVTTLVPIGRPDWFSNTCGPDPVAGQTTGSGGNGENNAPAGSTTDDPMIAVANPNNPVRVMKLSEATPQDMDWLDGERIIPGASCINTYYGGSTQYVNNQEFGFKMHDIWVRPLTITDASGANPRMYLKSYYAVYNSSRVFVNAPSGAVETMPSVEACLNPPSTVPPIAPSNPSGLCQEAQAAAQVIPTLDKYSLESPYNGTVRNLNFKSLHVSNDSGNTEIWTDVFGREVTTQDPNMAIKQYVSLGYNGVAGENVAGTIETSQSNKVCRTAQNLVLSNLPTTDECYWYDNGDLLFAKEWWRDYRNLFGIHAPN